MKKTNIGAIVINLDKAVNRWQFQQHQLSSLCLDFQRLRASQIDELSQEDYEQWANRWQRKLRQTEVACFLSHYRAWQKVVELGEPLLILEDDALLSDKTATLLNQLSTMNHLPFEHLTLETRGRKKLIDKNNNKLDDDDMVSDICLHRLWLDRTGACAYILTPIGARKLLKRTEQKGAGLADALLCEQPHQLKSMQTVPALAIQMDMMTHYGVDLPNLGQASQSHISTDSHGKPQANSIIDNMGFKYRRILAQVKMGMVQLSHSSERYEEIGFDNEGVKYLKTHLDSTAYNL